MVQAKAGLFAILVTAMAVSAATGPVSADDSSTYVKRSFLGGAITLLAPPSLTPGSASAENRNMVRLKYGGRIPAENVLTDTDGAINVVVRYGQQRVPMKALPVLKNRIRGLIDKRRPGNTWHEIRMRTINGKQYLFYNFTSSAIDTKVRNLTLMTSLRGRLLVISFNVTEARIKTWLPVANRVIQSVRLSP